MVLKTIEQTREFEGKLDREEIEVEILDEARSTRRGLSVYRITK